MSLRAARRAVALGFALFWCFIHYWLLRLRGTPTLEQRAYWLHQAAHHILASLQIRYTVEGVAPRSGIIVANHLSYLDIAILSAITPCFFVAKLEIRNWPYFGRAARAGGTIFIDRSSRASSAEVAAEIAQRLSMNVPILFFPEGTSTDGSAVLPFHRYLFEPAVQAGATVTPAAIRYVLGKGVEEKELCWFGDQTFLPHLWKALSITEFTAHVQFAETQVYPDRRAASEHTHATISALRAEEVSV